MEQPCYKCGQPVEQGVPFCSHCSAPQIRVVVAERVPSPAASADSNEASQGPAELPASQTAPILAVPMQWSQALRPCALAALVGIVLVMLRLYPIVAMISVGFLAVIFYRQRRPQIAIKGLTGAALGALSGLLWFAILSVFEGLIVILLHKGPEQRDQLIKMIDQVASTTSDPKLLTAFAQLKTPDGLEVLMVMLLFFTFFAAILLASLGGILGAAIVERRNKT